MKQPKGFSLLEVLMAFAIMAVAITIILRIFSSGVNNAVITEEYSIGVQLAESLMARTGIEIPLQAGDMNGNEANKYQWLISITDINPNQASQPAFQTSPQNQAQNPPSPMYLVKVLVSWGDEGSKPRVVELSSMKSL
jgi:general secretion pathway protein I